MACCKTEKLPGCHQTGLSFAAKTFNPRFVVFPLSAGSVGGEGYAFCLCVLVKQSCGLVHTFKAAIVKLTVLVDVIRKVNWSEILKQDEIIGRWGI